MIPPPPIQGIGNAGGFTMQVELRDGSFDYAKLQRRRQHDRRPTRAAQSTVAARLTTSFRADAPQLDVNVDRVKAETLGVPVGDVFGALASYLGSSYVSQFNKFGRVFQVYVQADSHFRAAARRPAEPAGAQPATATWCRSARWSTIEPVAGPSLISLYNLYPVGDDHRRAGAGLQLRPGA